MKASPDEKLVAKLYFRAAFPAMKVPLLEEEKFKKSFKGVKALIQICAKDDEEPLACRLKFDDGNLEFCQGVYENGEFKFDTEDADFLKKPDINLEFATVASMVDVFKGGIAGIIGPILKNIGKLPLLLKFLFLLLSLMIMMPNAHPKDEFGMYKKVKMSLYMITTALSQANKLGWKPMVDWTANQTDRIFQFYVGATENYPEIGAYLRVKRGNTKSGRGVYERKDPFVLFKFRNPDGCMDNIDKSRGVSFVECVGKGSLEIVGAADSYAVQFNDIMSTLQNMLI